MAFLMFEKISRWFHLGGFHLPKTPRKNPLTKTPGGCLGMGVAKSIAAPYMKSLGFRISISAGKLVRKKNTPKTHSVTRKSKPQPLYAIKVGYEKNGKL